MQDDDFKSFDRVWISMFVLAAVGSLAMVGVAIWAVIKLVSHFT